MSKVYVGHAVELRLDAVNDISAGTAFGVRARKPSGAVVTWSAARSGTEVVYTTVGYVGVGTPYDLDESGVWRLQAAVTIGGVVLYGETVGVVVYALGE